MTKVLRCRDAGMDCEFEARSDDEDELVEIAKQHAAEEHGISQIPEGMLAQIRGIIREE